MKVSFEDASECCFIFMPTVDKVSEHSKIQCIILTGMRGFGHFLSLPGHAGGNTTPMALLCFDSRLVATPTRLCRQHATDGLFSYQRPEEGKNGRDVTTCCDLLKWSSFVNAGFWVKSVAHLSFRCKHYWLFQKILSKVCL